MTEKKRLITKSMLSTFKACRWKYWHSYVEGLTPAKQRVAPARGNLFHDLLKGLYLSGEDFDYESEIKLWRENQMERAVKQYEQTKQTFGFSDEQILVSMEEASDEVAKETGLIYQFYLDNVYVYDADEYDVIFAEKAFEVPIVDRADRKHKNWRLGGKWDMVVRQKDSGKVFIWDHKLTARDPAQFILDASLDTQPVAYTWAGKYLFFNRDAIYKNEFENERKLKSVSGAFALNIDGPKWPEKVEAPSGFVLSVTRRKIPTKPFPVKKGDRLSKTSMKNTTVELLYEAIAENNFDPNDYKEEIEGLKHARQKYFMREEVAVGMQEIERWMEETRLTCEEILRVERFGRERLYRTDPSICQNQYMKRCVYWPLCYEDPDVAIADYIKREPHKELSVEED